MGSGGGLGIFFLGISSPIGSAGGEGGRQEGEVGNAHWFARPGRWEKLG